MIAVELSIVELRVCEEVLLKLDEVEAANDEASKPNSAEVMNEETSIVFVVVRG